MGISVAEIQELVNRLAKAAKEVQGVANVFSARVEDGTGEGYPNLAPALAVAYFKERWSVHANNAALDLSAAASLMNAYANYLSQLDDSIGFIGGGR